MCRADLRKRSPKTPLLGASTGLRPGRLVVIAENHSTIGGLGQAIAGVLMPAKVRPEFQQIALPDQFLDAEALPTLHDR